MPVMAALVIMCIDLLVIKMAVRALIAIMTVMTITGVNPLSTAMY